MFLNHKNFFVQCPGEALHQSKNSICLFCRGYIFGQHIEFDLVPAKEEHIGHEPWQYYLQSQRLLISSLPNFSQFRKRLHDSVFQVLKFVVGGKEAKQRLPVMLSNVKNKNIEECSRIRNKDFPIAILVSHGERKGRKPTPPRSCSPLLHAAFALPARQSRRTPARKLHLR